MRLVSAFVPTLFLFAASAAFAAPATTGSAPPPSDGRSQPPAATDDKGRAKTDGTSIVVASSAQLSGAYPAFGSGATGPDEGTEANCYAVFGELRCDRVPSHAPSHPSH